MCTPLTPSPRAAPGVRGLRMEHGQILQQGGLSHQPPAAPPRPPRSSSSERVTLKKEIGLVSACAIIIGKRSLPPPGTERKGAAWAGAAPAVTPSKCVRVGRRVYH
uniref:Uncharacterized protein n=1 Tax=Chrysemys picta bellii TaxID=8478 RepID=A0A8C3F8A8_CHRPI